MEKISREKLLKSLKELDKEDVKTKYARGLNLLAIKALIKYLKNNDDPELQERLNKELIKLQTDKNENTDVLHIYNNNLANPITLYYIYELYKDGVKSSDGSRNIILPKQNVASYYLYLAHNAVQKYSQESNIAKKINNDFNANKEKICYRYFEFLKRKYNLDNLNGIERIKAEYYFISELRQAKNIADNTDYLRLAILKEFVVRPKEKVLSRGEVDNFKDIIQIFEDKIEKHEKVESIILKLLGGIYYNGLKGVSDEDIILQDQRKAIKIYEQMINRKEADLEVYSNLINIYNDDKNPLYDKSKADKLLETVARNGLHIKRKMTTTENIEPSIYVCSDLHGQYHFYKAIIDQLKENDKLYILGDVIDRGADGIKILKDIMKRKEQGQVEFLIGNHELMMIQSLILGNEKVKQNWIWGSNGGDKTLKQFEKLECDEQNKIKKFLLDSYVYKSININSQNVHLVHAKSIQDRSDSKDKKVREMLIEGKEDLMSEALWERVDGDNLYSKTTKPRTITIIGHSPTENNKVTYKNGYIDIDCGGGYSYASLVNLTKGTIKYFEQKQEEKKYENRQKGR